MTNAKNSRMGLFSSLKGLIIRFNPKPWSNPEHIQTKTVKRSKPLKIQESNALKTTMVKSKNKSFVDLHFEVAKKVDAFIEQMEQYDRLDDKSEQHQEQNLDLTPDQTIANIDDLLRS